MKTFKQLHAELFANESIEDSIKRMVGIGMVDKSLSALKSKPESVANKAKGKHLIAE